MAVHTYECLFLLDPNKASTNWNAVSADVNGIIERNGGEIFDSRPWGEPKLAYPIEKFRKGVYMLTYFNCESTKIAAIEADSRLNESVLRLMILKLHPQIAEEIMAHLHGESNAEEHHEEEAEPAESAH